MNQAASPEIGKSIVAGGIRTNYLEAGQGAPVVMIHGSGPGVTAYANWRLVMPKLAERFRVLAPDMVGFGYTERPADASYSMDAWVAHIVGFLDALELPKVNLVGNSFGGALSLALATRYPERVDRLVLMGSVGTRFDLTPGLDAVWGYEPSIENMRELISVFAYDQSLMTEQLVRSRFEASTRPGFHESFSAMFPAPRQRHIDMLATPEEQIRKLDKEVLIVHGREDRVIPLQASMRLFELIERSQLHVFGRCGHWTQIEHASRFANLLEDFFLEQQA
ncbi:MAG: 2-hydroxy-6-oxo-2,4-heptadienoate hydrolase [Herminiimonas sp.]|jgi:2-hydroxymuconate-semialdehyde hydrolase|nr:2-hydroxy-6-oxo-2,4-heptadienoate hydrolase [Herminiimonas sp.]